MSVADVLAALNQIGDGWQGNRRSRVFYRHRNNGKECTSHCTTACSSAGLGFPPDALTLAIRRHNMDLILDTVLPAGDFRRLRFFQLGKLTTGGTAGALLRPKPTGEGIAVSRKRVPAFKGPFASKLPQIPP